MKQPFCSQLEERLLLWLEYHPQVASYARGDIGSQFATTYRLPIPEHAPFVIGYTFEGEPHDYLPDVVGTLTSGKPFIAEAGMEDDKRGDRNLAKAEAARRLARLQGGVFWIGTERTLTRAHHYNLVFLHVRRKTFPAFAEIMLAVQEVWPWGEVASVQEIENRLVGRWPANLVEAAIWKLVGDSLAAGHLLVDLKQHTLDRKLLLALLPPNASPLVPDPLPDTLLPEPDAKRFSTFSPSPHVPVPGPTFDASTLDEKQRERFHRNLRAVEQVLAGALQTKIAEELGIDRSTLSRLVKRTRELGQIACVPHGRYRRAPQLHPAFARVYPSAVSAPDTPDYDRHPRTYGDAPGGDVPLRSNRNNSHASLLQTGSHASQPPQDGAGISGSTRTGKIGSPCARIPSLVCAFHSGTRAADAG